ncbi:MAG: glutaminase, partial [Pseudobdellovibrio sp.]
DRMTHLFTSLVGRPVKVNHNIFESEKRTAYRNKAIAYLLKHFNVISDDIDGALDLYFKQCSISMNCEDLSMMAATLAHQGVQPRTKENIYSEEIVNQILSLVFSCGMYDTAGTWSFSVGIPAKSGVSGAMFAVIPGKMGISCYSPLINEHGHSIRGVLAISDLAKLLDYNLFKK